MSSKIWSEPLPKIILLLSSLNFLAIVSLKRFPFESGYLLMSFETLMYSRTTFGLGPNADSFAESFILATFWTEERNPPGEIMQFSLHINFLNLSHSTKSKLSLFLFNFS